MTTRALEPTLTFFSDLLDGTLVDQTSATAELEWPGGGRIRLEEHPDRTPGVARLELVGSGPARNLMIAGTPFVIRPTE